MPLLRDTLNAFLSPFRLKLIRADSLHFLRATAPYGVSLFDDLLRLCGDKPAATIFDVGANVGQFAEAAAATFPGAGIWSFEPISTSFEELKRVAGRWPRIRPFPFALGDRNETAEMKLYAHSTMNSLAHRPPFEDAHSAPIGSTQVSVRTLDEFCLQEKVTRIDLLKVDTEGFDLNVLRGGAGMLGDGAVRFVTAEFYRPTPAPGRQGGALSEVSEFLGGFDFEFVTAYTDYVMPKKRYFGVHNALFAGPC
jgi:FkbM family methyltransferase